MAMYLTNGTLNYNLTKEYILTPEQIAERNNMIPDYPDPNDLRFLTTPSVYTIENNSLYRDGELVGRIYNNETGMLVTVKSVTDSTITVLDKNEKGNVKDISLPVVAKLTGKEVIIYDDRLIGVSDLKFDSDGALTYKLTVNKLPITDLAQYIGYTTTIVGEESPTTFTIIHDTITNLPQLLASGHVEDTDISMVFIGEFTNGNYKFSRVRISGYEIGIEGLLLTDDTWKTLILSPPVHEYVDLGLPSGTLWATMNVGAETETDYGNYYMYGMGAKAYDSSDTPYAGTEDPLALSADTARQVWGGDWHMPTQAQMQELIDNTNNEWTTVNNVNGYKFTSKTDSSKYIFIPAAGYWSYGSQIDVDNDGYYWGSSPDGSDDAYYLFFGNGDKGVYDFSRTDGYSVRPVIG